jgi:hypothetical protein
MSAGTLRNPFTVRGLDASVAAITANAAELLVVHETYARRHARVLDADGRGRASYRAGFWAGSAWRGWRRDAFSTAADAGARAGREVFVLYDYSAGAAFSIHLSEHLVRALDLLLAAAKRRELVGPWTAVENGIANLNARASELAALGVPVMWVAPPGRRQAGFYVIEASRVFTPFRAVERANRGLRSFSSVMRERLPAALRDELRQRLQRLQADAAGALEDVAQLGGDAAALLRDIPPERRSKLKAAAAPGAAA